MNKYKDRIDKLFNDILKRIENRVSVGDSISHNDLNALEILQNLNKELTKKNK